MVLAVHRDPLFGVDPGSQPQREFERPLHRGMDDQRFVRRSAMQKDRRRKHGDLDDDRGRRERNGERHEH